MSRKRISTTEELNNCNSIKAILMLFVVLGHAMSMYGQGGTWGPYEPVYQAPAIGILASWIGSFHIYGFALISGYIFYYVKFEKGGIKSILHFY